MPILNYTTKINVSQTVQEIQAILGRSGAHSATAHYKDGEPVAIFFSIELNKHVLNYRLPSQWEGVFASIKKIKKYKYPKTEERAKKVAWRIIKDWVEAQVALIEAGQAQLAEVFLPYAVTSDGSTLFQKISHNPQLMLGA